MDGPDWESGSVRIADALPYGLKSRLAQALLLAKHALERNPVSHRLSLNLSQAGQDMWVYGEVFNERRNGYFVDIGAHDGVFLSNTYLLERRYGWSGICVEANPVNFERLRRQRRAVCVNACLDSVEQDVAFAPRGVMGGIVSPTTDIRAAASGETISLRTRTLENVLREHRAPHEIDYLSIDIEGAEERVLGDFAFDAYSFTCITIERPSANLQEVLGHHGYVVIKSVPWLDYFYVHQQFMPKYEDNMMAFYSKRFLRVRWW